MFFGDPEVNPDPVLMHGTLWWCAEVTAALPALELPRRRHKSAGIFFYFVNTYIRCVFPSASSATGFFCDICYSEIHLFVLFVLQPERIDPSASRQGYDVRSDVWSLGITLVSPGNVRSRTLLVAVP